MNERLMRFGAVMYDGWWIGVLALALSGGISYLLPYWWPWWPAMAVAWPLAFVLGWQGGRAMSAWHDRCVAREWRKILAMRVPLTEAFWQMTREGGDVA